MKMEERLDKIIELLELLVIKDVPTVNIPSVWEDQPDLSGTITKTSESYQEWPISTGDPHATTERPPLSSLTDCNEIIDREAF